jgi:hypothetical protein
MGLTFLSASPSKEYKERLKKTDFTIDKLKCRLNEVYKLGHWCTNFFERDPETASEENRKFLYFRSEKLLIFHLIERCEFY